MARLLRRIGLATVALVLVCALLAAHGFPGLERPGPQRAFVQDREAPAAGEAPPVVLLGRP